MNTRHKISVILMAVGFGFLVGGLLCADVIILLIGSVWFVGGYLEYAKLSV